MKRIITKIKSFKLPLITLLLALISISAVLLIKSGTANAQITGWKAGRIIDDTIFTSKSSMSVSQVQSFLNSKVPSCDTYGQKLSEYGGPDLNGDGKVQRWEWGKQYYNQTTFRCLKDYTEGGKTAAEIIVGLGQKYSISPKVLLVLLQKEQSLVTDSWPLNVQYRSATGYGCPDTAACDTTYYGFTNQVKWAAAMFHAIMVDSSTWYTPYELGNNYIRYNPDASCGGSVVNIENRATQALYNYTPYQPNQAALSADWGTAHCGAYGNRNFYLYFTKWFGPTLLSSVYSYNATNRQYYSDSSYNNEITDSIPNMQPGQTIYVKMSLKNSGNQPWYKDYIKIGTSDPRERSSDFHTAGWLSETRAATLASESGTIIYPGETGIFKFPIKAPADLGSYKEVMGLVIEGQRWFSATFNIYANVTSSSPYYRVKPISFKAYSDESMQHELNRSDIVRYTNTDIFIKAIVKNTGNQTFPSSLTRIATTSPKDRQSPYQDDSWLSASRVLSSQSGDITPQETSTFTFKINTPSASLGKRLEQFGILIEGQRWLSENIGSLNITTVNRPDSVIGRGVTLNRGQTVVLSGNATYLLSFQNDGNLILRSLITGEIVWYSKTHDKGGVVLKMQHDGNLVIYDSSNKAVWATGTYKKNGNTLRAQYDGNLVIYDSSNKAVWATGTYK